MRHWEGVIRAFLIAMALALGACPSHSSGYTRTDGEHSTLAQCKGEGATAIVQTTGSGAVDAFERARKEAAVVNACMARNGYIQAQQ